MSSVPVNNHTFAAGSAGSLRTVPGNEADLDNNNATSTTFDTFCNATSLHGWKYLSKSGANRPLRVAWVAVVVGAMGVAGFFLAYSLNDFLSSTVQTTQDTSR